MTAYGAHTCYRSWAALGDYVMGLAARKMKDTLPTDLAIDAEVDLCMSGDVYFLQARLNVSVPSLDRETA